MPSDSYTYVGTDAGRTYQAYVDLDTGRMLSADPGRTYRMRSVNGEQVPPGDGRWVGADPLAEYQAASNELHYTEGREPAGGLRFALPEREPPPAGPAASEEPGTETIGQEGGE